MYYLLLFFLSVYSMNQGSLSSEKEQTVYLTARGKTVYEVDKKNHSDVNVFALNRLEIQSETCSLKREHYKLPQSMNLVMQFMQKRPRSDGALAIRSVENEFEESKDLPHLANRDLIISYMDNLVSMFSENAKKQLKKDYYNENIKKVTFKISSEQYLYQFISNGIQQLENDKKIENNTKMKLSDDTKLTELKTFIYQRGSSLSDSFFNNFEKFSQTYIDLLYFLNEHYFDFKNREEIKLCHSLIMNGCFFLALTICQSVFYFVKKMPIVKIDIFSIIINDLKNISCKQNITQHILKTICITIFLTVYYAKKSINLYEKIKNPFVV